LKVFVAGASGAIGRRLVPRLLEAGHPVVGMTRSEESAARLRELGAEAVVCDVHDADRLAAAVAAAAPHALVHQLTDLPAHLSPRKLKAAYAANNEVRRVGTRNLLAAARGAGVRRMVVQSTAFWYRPDGAGGAPVGEDHPLDTDAPGIVGTAVRTMAEVEEQVRDSGLEAVVLRYGMFYGPGTWYAPDGDVGRQVAKRRYPVIGRGAGVFSFVHVDDAADATVRALEAPPGTYNVVDDEPAPMSEWLPAYAQALGAAPPRRAPRALAMLAAGRAPVQWMDTMVGAGNARAKRELGWAPAHPTWRTGFRETPAP
jgi:nucleoside-diphosphate-sugar epimerase